MTGVEGDKQDHQSAGRVDSVRILRESLALMGSPLARRVALLLFIAILIVQALILLPSTLKKEDELIQTLVRAGEETLRASIQVPGADVAPGRVVPVVLGADLVVGVRVTSAEGVTMAAGGEVVELDPAAVPASDGMVPVLSARSADGTRIEAQWPVDTMIDRRAVTLRIDTSEVDGQVHAFLLQVAGIVVLVAAALTFAALIAVSGVVLRPLIRLRDLLRSGASEDWPDQSGLAMARRDEIGEVYRAIADQLSALNSIQDELEDRVMERSTLLNDAIENASDGFIVYDADGGILLHNSRYREYFSYSEEDMARCRTAEDLDRLDKERGWFLADSRGKFGTASNAIGDFEGRTPEGRWLAVRRRPTATGGVVATQVDVTHERSQEQRLNELLNAVPTPLVLTDMRTGVINFANHHATELYGLTVGGKPVESFYRDVSRREELISILREVGRVDNFEAEISDGKGGWHWVLMSARIMNYQGTTCVLVASYVITERKRAQQILAKEKSRVEELSRKKSEFVAVISHEVRTPMNGVLGMARLLLESDMTHEQRDFAETILRSGESLLTILNDLLDISKLEAGKLDLERIAFSPKAIVHDALGLMTGRAEEKGLSIVLDIDPNMPEAVRGDPHRMRQILLNLLSNAVKFTPAGAVTIGLKQKSANGTAQITLSVSDTGVGIKPELQESLFSAYSQASTEIARKYGGTGLGLNICRRLAGLMGGEITLESKVGEGSTFSFSAPFEITDVDEIPVVPPIKEAARSELTILAPFKVLLVEDNEINRRVAIGMLARQGHSVVTADDGQQALEMLEGDLPDIILMDRHMPIMNGLEATRRIRSLGGPAAALPIIGVTAAANSEEVAACLAAGMNDVVTKPIHPAMLARALAKFSGAKCGPAVTEEPIECEGGDLPDVDGETSETAESVKSGVAGLMADCGDDLALSLIEKFISKAESAPVDLRMLLADDDLDGLRRTVHDLKSNSATLGMPVLAVKFRHLEHACIGDDREELDRRIDTLPEQLRISLPQLRDAVAKTLEAGGSA